MEENQGLLFDIWPHTREGDDSSGCDDSLGDGRTPLAMVARALARLLCARICVDHVKDGFRVVVRHDNAPSCVNTP